MNDKKTMKRALLSSVIAMFLCIAMLIGTTFAWFTDSATSGVNKIQAGNLDVEVDYSQNGTTWTTIEGTSSLFSEDLWEPGHTEVVYLRVKNAGTLGLNYKVLVTPVSENGGVNVEGRNFKLSDYLVFGTTTPSTTPTTYTRDTARAAVGSTTGLANVNSLTKTGTMVGKNVAGYADQYMALVVYMPETVGNEANYKTGTAAPTIELGIKVVATQLTAENDSFDNTYDEGAVTDSAYTVGAYYDYFEAVNVTDTAADDGSFTVQKTGSTGILASASGTAAAGAKVNLLVMKSADAEKNFSITVADGEELNGYDIKVTGQTNGSLVQGKLYVGTGLENFVFYHNGVAMTVGTQNSLTDGQYYYNSTDGYVYFASTTFSPFQATYKAPVAAIGTAVYGTLVDAFAAVKSGETITLLKSSAGNGIKVPSGSNFTVDFRGFTYNIDGSTVGSEGTETNGFQLLMDSSITFKDGSLTSNKAKILIQNYANLTLDNMNLSASEPCGYVLSNNNGDIIINDTTITAPEGKVAFDICSFGSYRGPEVTVQGNSVINGKVEISEYDGSHEKLKLNVTGGTFNGIIEKANEANDFVGNITGGRFSSDPNAYCAGGYCALPEGGVYKVVEGCLVSNKNELVAAANGQCSTIYLKNSFTVGSTVTLSRNVTLNGLGYTLTAYYANPVIDIRGAVDVTLKDVNINFPFYTSKEGVRAIGTGNKLTFENVNITNAFKAIHFSDCRGTVVSIKGCNLTSVYPFNVDGGDVASFVVEDSVLNGWTSFSNSTQCTYQFKNCSFGMGNNQATVKPYGNTTFENCTFSADYFESLEGGIASGTTTPITINFNSCYMITSDGITEALTVDLLKTAFNYDITSGSNSGDSTINDQLWYVNGEQIAFVTEAE